MRFPTRALAALAVAILLSIPAPAAAQQGLRVVPLARGEQVWVSFQLADGFTDEVRAAIRSGLRTTFTYTVDLRLDVPWGVDRIIGTATVTSSVEFDNLTRGFKVVRSLDGRTSDNLQTDDESLVRQFMTKMDRLPLFKTSLLEPNREYYVKVAASARPSNGSLLWPFGSGTSAQTKFTFIR
jgi:hypothetical protein